MPDREDPPPSALARGAAKSSDVERVRRDVDKAAVRKVQDDQASVAHRRRRLGSRSAARKPDAQP